MSRITGNGECRLEFRSNVNIYLRPIYLRKMSDTLSENDVLECIADEKSLHMVRCVHNGLPVTITSMKLSRKQYYHKLKMISDANLISRSYGRYTVTSLGRVVLGLLDSLETALNKDYWKFIAIDNLTNADHPMPVEEQTRIISSIMESKDMAEALLQH
jgi:hypothetical protein